MKNIFLFIRTYFTLVFFILLEIISFSLLDKASGVHHAFFAFYNNELLGRINSTTNEFYVFFSLKENNRRLSEENARLKAELAASMVPERMAIKYFSDSSFRDTSGHIRKFTYLPAMVVGNTTTFQNNYLTIERGALQGIKKGMSVLSPQGIVGVVIQVSDNYCMAMSLLNRNTKVSAMLKKNNVAGSVEWSGTDPSLLTLKNISKAVKVSLGDTVVTSSYSANFPQGIMVGTVVARVTDPTGNYYSITVKSSTDFARLQNVYIVKNVRFEEQKDLENKTLKGNE